jgi:glycine hydroxymethyltransferase
MAEGLFAAMVRNRDDFLVTSAGLNAMNGQRASAHTTDLLRSKGIDLSRFRSSMLTRETAEAATHIFCMTRGHRHGVEMLFPDAADKTYLVSEFTPDDKLRGHDVPDPIGLGRAAYEETFRTLQRALPSILAYIDQTWKGSQTASRD